MMIYRAKVKKGGLGSLVEGSAVTLIAVGLIAYLFFAADFYKK